MTLKSRKKKLIEKNIYPFAPFIFSRNTFFVSSIAVEIFYLLELGETRPVYLECSSKKIGRNLTRRMYRCGNCFKSDEL